MKMNKNKINEKAMGFVNSMKEGLIDVKNMSLEQNYKPFLIPAIILLAAWFGLGYVNDKSRSKVIDIRNQVEAQKAETNNMQDYTKAKEVYESVIGRLPPSINKNEWLYTTMESIFNELKINPGRTGKLVMEEEDPFTLASVTYETDMDYNQLGKLVEAIESPAHPYLRIADLNISRNEGSLGFLKVGLRVNTVFVNEK